MTHQDDLFQGAGSLLPMHTGSRAERLIQFGKKYRNQPYEVLLSDPSYALWLLNSMFAKLQEQHPALLAFLMNRFGVPDRTPDHNRLQNQFLDPDFALRFALAVSPVAQQISDLLSGIDFKASWTRYARDVLAKSKEQAERMARYSKTDIFSSVKDALLKQGQGLDIEVVTGQYVDGIWTNPVDISRLQFEHEGADVFYLIECIASLNAAVPRNDHELPTSMDPTSKMSERVSSLYERDAFRIEVKPVVGDDYPAILRSMKAVKDTHLLVGEYSGAGATWEEVVAIFRLSGMTAVLLETVEQTPIPTVFQAAAAGLPTTADLQAIVETEYSALGGT